MHALVFPAFNVHHGKKVSFLISYRFYKGGEFRKKFTHLKFLLVIFARIRQNSLVLVFKYVKIVFLTHTRMYSQYS